MRRARIPAALAIALALAGCGGAVDTASSLLGTKSRPCPRALLVGDAQRLVDLAPGPISAESVRLTARVTLPVAECDYEEDKILVDLSVPIDARRGPQLPSGSLQFDLRYFVAVTDRFGKVLGKRIFTTELTMGGDEQRTSELEQIEQIIPLGPGQDGNSFIIYIGFQLTREQLDFNRKNLL
jgi:hypothetical protein